MIAHFKSISLFCLATLALQASSKADINTINLPDGTGLSGVIITGDQREYFTRGNIDIDENTLFEIGSITKVFTALATARHEVQNPGFLNTNISEFVPETKGSAIEHTTLLQLATHTSGFPRLPSSMGILYRLFNRDDPYKEYSREDLIEDLQQESAPPLKPSFTYSNFGYISLGLALEKSQHTEFSKILKEQIFEPLGMKTSFVHYTDSNEKQVVPGHGQKGEITSVWHMDAAAPAGAIKSSVYELSLFLSSYLNPPSPQTTLGKAMKLTQEPQIEVNERQAIGLSWIIRKSPEGNIYWHNGGTGGFRSFIAFEPKTQRGVILLSNFAGVETLDPAGFMLLKDGLPKTK